MKKETMTSRERWLAVLKRQKPDRIPMDYWATAEASDKLKKHLGVSEITDVFKKLHIDRPADLKLPYIGPAIDNPDNVWGWKTRPVDYGTGKYNEVYYWPLKEYNTVEEIKKNYKWPSVDWWDFSTLKKQAEALRDRPIAAGYSEFFYQYKYMRGDEQTFIDLIENPELVHYIVGEIFKFRYETARRIYEQVPGQVTLSYIAEDLGSQEDLLYSPTHIREFMLPYMKKMMDLAHQAGAYVMTHSDGAVRKIIPDLIETGTDVLNPIQWPCKGMEPEGLKKDFGDKLIFHGGVDNQKTLPFGKPEDVKKEVKMLIETLGKGGGYVLAPCHNIQVVSPAENVVALYEAGLEYGS